MTPSSEHAPGGVESCQSATKISDQYCTDSPSAYVVASTLPGACTLPRVPQTSGRPQPQLQRPGSPLRGSTPRWFKIVDGGGCGRAGSSPKIFEPQRGA